MSDLAENLPIYIRIVEGVKDAILNGELKEEGQLPSTTYLSKTYNINIATVNKAINILVDENLAYKKRGIGMFVYQYARIGDSGMGGRCFGGNRISKVFGE